MLSIIYLALFRIYTKIKNLIIPIILAKIYLLISNNQTIKRAEPLIFNVIVKEMGVSYAERVSKPLAQG